MAIKLDTKISGTSKHTASEFNASINPINNTYYDYMVSAGISTANTDSLKNGLNNFLLSRSSGFSVGGSVNAITLTSNSLYSHIPVSNYTTGLLIEFIATADNTGITTINIDGLGTKTIKNTAGANINAGNIKNGNIVRLRYDGTNFQLLNPYILLGGIVPVNTLLFERNSNTILILKAGLKSAGDLSRYINFGGDININFDTTGLNARSTNTSRSTNTWYYIFACAKADGTSAVIVDSSSDGSDALIDFTTQGFETATMVLAGVWKTDASSNLRMDRNYEPYVYEIDNQSTTQTFATSTTGTLVTVDVPTGYKSFVEIQAKGFSNTASISFIHPDATAYTPDGSTRFPRQIVEYSGVNVLPEGNLRLYTNTSAQIKAVSLSGTPNVNINTISFRVIA